MDVFSQVSDCAINWSSAHLEDVDGFLKYGRCEEGLPESYRGKGNKLIFRFSGIREHYRPWRSGFYLVGDVGVGIAARQEYRHPLDVFDEGKNPTVVKLEGAKIAIPDESLFVQISEGLRGKVERPVKIPIGKEDGIVVSPELREEAEMDFSPDSVKTDYSIACLQLLFGYAQRTVETGKSNRESRKLVQRFLEIKKTK